MFETEWRCVRMPSLLLCADTFSTIGVELQHGGAAALIVTSDLITAIRGTKVRYFEPAVDIKIMSPVQDQLLDF
jgi:hypothetical protein